MITRFLLDFIDEFDVDKLNISFNILEHKKCVYSFEKSLFIEEFEPVFDTLSTVNFSHFLKFNFSFTDNYLKIVGYKKNGSCLVLRFEKIEN